MKTFFLIFLCPILLIPALNAQPVNDSKAKALVKGVITDEYTGEPIDVTIEIRSAAGQKFKIKSNSKTGQFDQLLSAGETYTLIFTRYDIPRTIETLRMEAGEKYFEQKVDFTVKRLTQGRVFESLNLFKQADTTLNPDAVKELDKLKELLRFNRSAKFDLKLTVLDINRETERTIISPPEKPKKNAKPKKQIEQPKIEIIKPDSAFISTMIEARERAFYKYFESFGDYKSRLKIIKDYSVAPKAANETEAEKEIDFFVIVAKFDNVFE
ncbi:MAG: hypothetical protein NT007_02185 [Candidatus Kapabacteria bacterium]|nr:hypothetical protein [Candidatus Kapabacteria bacterium]